MKLSRVFSWAESRILAALSKLGEYLLNPQIRTFSRATQGAFRNSDVENQESRGDRSQNDPHSEVEFFACCARNLTNSDPEETSHVVTIVQEVIPNAPLQLRQENKRRRAQQVSHSFAVKTPLPQLKQTRYCYAFNNWRRTVIRPISTTTSKESRISKLPKTPTTTMPKFDAKSEKFELFEHLFHASLKIHNQLTEENKTNYFHPLMCGDALQTFKNITSPNRENLAVVLTVFRRKNVKAQSMAPEKHKFQRLVFNPANQKLIDFLDELQKVLAKDAFGVAAWAIIEQFIFAIMAPHLRSSINQAHLDKSTYEQIVSHLERELELNGLKAPGELQINCVTQQATQQNPEKPKPTCHHCKIPSHYQTQCRQFNDPDRNNTNSAENNNKKVVIKRILTPTKKILTIPQQTIQIFKKQKT